MSSSTPTAPAAATTAARVRVLLADDHQMLRQGLRTMIEECPDLEVVAEADNGRRAVELASELRPDVVIMDVTMPELNGVEATRQIRSACPGAKVVALSMHPERQFVAEMLNVGASGYLLKDCPFDELVSAIRAATAGEVYLSPKVAGVVVRDYVGGSLAGGGTAAGKAGAGGPPPFGTLTPREREVLQLLADGKNTKQIAMSLHVSTKTVETHRRQVMEKLKIYSVAELTRYAIREGVTSLS